MICIISFPKVKVCHMLCTREVHTSKVRTREQDWREINEHKRARVATTIKTV